MPTSRRVRLDTGLEIHLLEWGANDKQRDQTILLIHGFLDLAWGWVPTVEAGLADRFHVVAPDMRGHGDSERVGAGGYYHFFDYLADLQSIVDKVARRRLSLVGHSMGGSIASYYAGTYPERVSHLVLMEGTGPPEPTEPAPQRVKSWIRSWKSARSLAQRTYASVDEAAARLQKNDPLLSEDLALELAEYGTTVARSGRIQFKHDPLHVTLGPYPFRLDTAQSFWRQITCPVLLIEGGRSMLRHPEAEAQRRRASFKNARLEKLERAGHMMQRHEPEALAKLVADHVLN